jgi:pimeloyl-ACP methyl ester carboxylesterase
VSGIFLLCLLPTLKSALEMDVSIQVRLHPFTTVRTSFQTILLVVAALFAVLTSLVSGQTLTYSGRTGALGSSTYFSIRVPTACPALTIRSMADNGDADLYVRYNTNPTRVTHSAASDGAGSNESITIPNPRAGVWRVLVYGYGAYSGLTVTLDAPRPDPLPPAAVSMASVTSNSAGIAWTWGGNLAQVASVTVDLLSASGTRVAGYPKTRPTSAAGSFAITGLRPERSYGVRLRYNGKTGITGSMAERSFTTLATTSPPQTGTKVVLMLHGLNSDVYTWGVFLRQLAIAAYGRPFDVNSPVVDAASNTWRGDKVMDAYWYRMAFGYHDTVAPEVKGVAGLQSYGPASGDFSTFDELGTEVKMAISKIRVVIPDASILLIGHSRGGLAARSFLQNYRTSAEAQAVKGLITLGTPHSGSELGRLYNYLVANPVGGKAQAEWSSFVPRAPAGQLYGPATKLGECVIPAGFKPSVFGSLDPGVESMSVHFGNYYAGFDLNFNRAWAVQWAGTYWSDQTLQSYAIAHPVVSPYSGNASLRVWSADHATWQTVNNTAWLMDLRRPSVGMLAPESPELTALNAKANLLPTHVRYVSVVFDGIPFGRVQDVPDAIQHRLEVFGDGQTPPAWVTVRVSPTAQRHCIGAQTPVSLDGDGIVTEWSQSLRNVPNLPVGIYNQVMYGALGLLHTSETGSYADIMAAISAIGNAW